MPFRAREGIVQLTVASTLSRSSFDIFSHNIYMLFAGWEVCMVKTVTEGSILKPKITVFHCTDLKPANNMFIYIGVFLTVFLRITLLYPIVNRINSFRLLIHGNCKLVFSL